jgi:glycosyltransferase involved in cell wall biosynthesis
LNQGISIIICCFNSRLLLEQTLKHIGAQNIGEIACEVILVDNASTDNTQQTAESIWRVNGSDKINLKIVYEPQPGLSYARKRGINESVYDYIIFCDDDNWLNENYAQNTFKLFQSNEDAAILGGIATARFEDISSKPKWFDKFYHGYAIGPQGIEESYVNIVYGAGMAARKSFLKKIIDMYPMILHGRKQQQLTAGDDAEICFRMRLAGYKILFSPELTFQHFLTVKRLNWNYLKKLHTGFARSHVILKLYERALNSDDNKLPLFYWLKQALYYWGIYLKYWPKHYSAYRKGEGTIEEIRHITWKNIALNYFEYNFKTVTMYRIISAFKPPTSK